MFVQMPPDDYCEAKAEAVAVVKVTHDRLSNRMVRIALHIVCPAIPTAANMYGTLVVLKLELHELELVHFVRRTDRPRFNGINLHVNRWK